MSDPSCPRCGAAFDAHPDTTTSCRTCKGVFVARSQVDDVATSLESGEVPVVLGDAYRSAPASARAVSVTRADVQYLRCPLCNNFMNRKRLVKKLDLIVDICAAHGVWFDTDELQRVASHMASEGGEQGGSRVDLGIMRRSKP